MPEADISSIMPFFIVRDVSEAIAFYSDRFGFDVQYQGPSDDNIFFGIVGRGGASIMLKSVGVEPLPNCKRHRDARWDAYVHVTDPDTLAAEFSSRQVEFSKPLADTHDGLRGFEVEDDNGHVLFFGRPR